MTVYLVDSAITASFRLYDCAKASRTYCSIVHSSKHVNTLRCKISDEYVSIDNYTFASAQPQDVRFLVRLVQATAQEGLGLVNVSVQIGSVIVNDVIDINRNNIAVPIAANVNVGAQVCATVLSSGDQVCEFVQDVEQDARNRVTLDLSQAQ
jgi:hypothetical protein